MTKNPKKTFQTSRTVQKKNSNPQPDGTASFSGFDYNVWWKRNGDIVRNGMRGGSFFQSQQSRNSQSLERFEHVYDKDAIYQDLFVVARGRNAVRASFELIGSFWEIQLLEVGPVRLLPSVNNALLRVPYTIQQRPKHLPFSMLGWFQYQGWIDLYLKPIDDKNTAVTQDWQLYNHDDRLIIQAEQKGDMLTHIQGIPILAPIFEAFRLQHGYVVQYFSNKRYKRPD